MHHRRAIILIVALGTALGLVASRFLDPRYSARAMLWIEADRQDTGSAAASGGFIGMQAWSELVTSYAVLDHVVRELGLYVRTRTRAEAEALRGFEPASELQPGEYRLTLDDDGRNFLLETSDGRVVQRDTLGSTSVSAAGFVRTPERSSIRPGQSVEFRMVGQYGAIHQLTDDLRVDVDPNGSFLRIELKGTDPTLTTATVNAIADRVVVVASEMKTRKYDEVANILGEQYAHAEAALRDAESALRDFRERTADVARTPALAVTPDPDTRDNVVLDHAVEQQIQLEQLQQDRAAIGRILQQDPEAGLQLNALASIDAVRESPELSKAIDEATQRKAELRALEYRYTEESAPVMRARQDIEALEQRTIPRLAAEVASELDVRSRVLSGRIQSTRSDLRRIPALVLQEARLERDVASTEALSSNVRQRFEEARLALVSSLPDIRILDRAMQPQRPVFDYAPLLVILAFVSSLGAAILGANLIDRVDSKVRYPEQVTSELRLPILGALPHVGWQSLQTGTVSSEAIESLRGLRMRILQFATDGPLLLTITSPAAGEGKSFVSVNLALSFAYAGYRTLLIDGDVRRSTLHRVLDQPRRPGLTDALAGHASVDEVVRATGYDSLSLISGGTPMERAPELLLSPKLNEMLSELRATHDVIIVDSPPMSAGTDALVLASLTRDLVFVLRSGTTRLPLALAKLDVVQSFPVRAIGAVLNEVHTGDAFRNYTYDLSGYEQVDEVSEPDDPLRILGGRP